MVVQAYLTSANNHETGCVSGQVLLIHPHAKHATDNSKDTSSTIIIHHEVSLSCFPCFLNIIVEAHQSTLDSLSINMN